MCDKALPRDAAYVGLSMLETQLCGKTPWAPAMHPPPLPPTTPPPIKHYGPPPSLPCTHHLPLDTRSHDYHTPPPRPATPSSPIDLLPLAPRCYFLVINFKKLLLICYQKFLTTWSYLSTYVNKRGTQY